MQVQQFTPQVASTTQENEMEQLALLFGEQQLAMQAADAVVQKESEKTLAAFQTTIAAQAAENKALQNENAVLRERLAALETQKREAGAAHAAVARGKHARDAATRTAQEEASKKQQRVLDALEKIIRERIETEKWLSVNADYPHLPEVALAAARQRHAEFHAILLKQYERAKEGVFIEQKTLYPPHWMSY